MITGAHVMIFSKDAAADRAFLRDVLGFPCIDTGHDWLIFKLPATEAGVHPSDENDKHECYFMTDDLDAAVAKLAAHGVATTPFGMQGWGRTTRITLPGGGTLGLYEPRHARP